MSKLNQIPFWISLFFFAITSTNQVIAQNVEAEYIGPFKCPDKYAGSFLDIGRQECWSCPAKAPKRTIWKVDADWACERPAKEVFRKAKGPVNPTGFFKTDCQKGYFWDIGLGKCYSCEGWKRSVWSVKSAKACSTVQPLLKSKATRHGEVGCGEDGFEHFFSGQCYKCPAGSYRNANTGNDPSTFAACTYCGTLNGKPCPVTTLRKSCDVGLVEDFLKGTCVLDDSHESVVYRNAMAKAEELLPQMSGVLTNALTLSDDAEVANNLSAESPNAASAAEAKVGANPCVLDAFNAWSLGGTVSVGFILGGTLETGMAVDIRPDARTGATPQRNAFWYGAVSYNISLNVGATAGISYGCWVGDNNGLLGNFEGGTFDPFGLKGILALKEFGDIKEAFKGAGASLEMGVWFDPANGEFQGFTLTPGVGKGIGLGGYVKGTTGQIPGETASLGSASRPANGAAQHYPHFDGDYVIQNTWKCEEDHEFCDWNLSWQSDSPHPLATVENDQFAWQIKPVANRPDHYSITNKWQCPGQAWCDAQLSSDDGSSHPMASVEKDDPTIWKITQDPDGKMGHFLIQSTKACPGGEWCDANLSWTSAKPAPRATVEKDGFTWRIVRLGK